MGNDEMIPISYNYEVFRKCYIYFQQPFIKAKPLINGPINNMVFEAVKLIYFYHMKSK